MSPISPQGDHEIAQSNVTAPQSDQEIAQSPEVQAPRKPFGEINQ